MKVLFFIIALSCFAFGAMVFLGAKGAIHEIEAFLLFLIGSVFMCTAGVLEAIHVLRNQIVAAQHGAGSV